MNNLNKNQKIRDTYVATKLRRQSQSVQVVTVKVQENKLNNAQREGLKMNFVEAKWLYNHILSLSKNNDNINVFSIDYTDIDKVTHYDKDHNPIESTLTHLSSQMKQDIIRGICANISNLAKAKKKGLEVGALKFISEYNSINLKQYNVSHKIAGSRKIKIQGIKKPLPVNGLDQLKRFENYEIANAKLIKRPSGYYIALSVYINKDDVPFIEKDKGTIGIDMGCQTSFTLSDGRKFNFQIEESEQTKRLQIQLQRKVKGSNNWWKAKLKLQKAHEKDTNRRNDAAKKFAHLLKEYNVVIQNEQLNGWKENGHGKKVQHSILGRVKQLLIDDGATVLSEWLPTTKFCRNCGHKITLSERERVFKCPYCGTEEDRDIHAAKNMVWFKENIVGVERTEYKPAEFNKAVFDLFGVVLSDESQKQQEATNSLG